MKLEERITIEIKLNEGKSVSKIAKEMNKSKSTISNEIKKYKALKRNTKVIELHDRSDKEIMNTHPCKTLTNSPYVCNGCPRYTNNHCTYHYVEYMGNKANEQYKSIKSKSNQKINKVNILNDLKPLLEKGQPITHISSTLIDDYGDVMVSSATIYNWINKGLIEYNKKDVKRNKNKSKTEKVKSVSFRDLLKGKEYENFIEYISDPKNKFKHIVEIDLVCGKKGTNGYILTMFIPKLQFLMAYKLNNKTPQEVVRVFDEIESKIGYTTFKKLFGCILTDQGREFLDFKSICYSKKNNRRRTKIFYCHPSSPYEKPNIENIHRLLRRVFPKGKSLEKVTQEDLYEVVSNINSLKKKSYNRKTPNEMFIEHYSLSLLKKLSLEAYDAKEVVLLPYTNF